MDPSPSLRSLIARTFNDEELCTFCFDHFPVVYEAFTTGMTKGLMIQLLLDHCMRRRAGEVLLTALERERPGLIGADRDALLVWLDAARFDLARSGDTLTDIENSGFGAGRTTDWIENRGNTEPHILSQIEDREEKINTPKRELEYRPSRISHTTAHPDITYKRPPLFGFPSSHPFLLPLVLLSLLSIIIMLSPPRQLMFAPWRSSPIPEPTIQSPPNPDPTIQSFPRCNMARIIRSEVLARSEPHLEAPVIQRFVANEQVEVLCGQEQSGSYLTWVLVSGVEGRWRAGWVPLQDIEQIQ